MYIGGIRRWGLLMANLRSQAIRLAATLPEGSPERTALLQVLSAQPAVPAGVWMSVLKQLSFQGWALADEDFWGARPINRSGLDAVWEKKFEIGKSVSSVLYSTYGVSLTMRVVNPSDRQDADAQFAASALMGWTGPGVFAGRPRPLYSKEFPDAFTGAGRRWRASPDMVRWIEGSFKQLEAQIQKFVQEDIKEHSAKRDTGNEHGRIGHP